jgi:hypothetical protein
MRRSTYKSGNFGSQREPQDNKRLLPVGLDDQHVSFNEPAIQLAKPIGSGLYLDAKVAAQKWQHNIAGKTTAGRTGQWHSHRRNAVSLQRIDNAALGASAFATSVAAAHAATSPACGLTKPANVDNGGNLSAAKPTASPNFTQRDAW